MDFLGSTGSLVFCLETKDKGGKKKPPKTQPNKYKSYLLCLLLESQGETWRFLEYQKQKSSFVMACLGIFKGFEGPFYPYILP